MKQTHTKFEVEGFTNNSGEKQYRVYKYAFIKKKPVELNVYLFKDNDGMVINGKCDVSFDDGKIAENVVKEFIKYQNDKNVILAWDKEQKRILYIPRTNIEQIFTYINVLKNIDFIYHDYDSALEQDKKLNHVWTESFFYV